MLSLDHPLGGTRYRGAFSPSLWGCRPALGTVPWIWAAGHPLISLPGNLASDSSLFPEAEIVLNSLQKTSIKKEKVAGDGQQPGLPGLCNPRQTIRPSEPMQSSCVKWRQSWPPHTLSKINWNRKVQVNPLTNHRCAKRLLGAPGGSRHMQDLNHPFNLVFHSQKFHHLHFLAYDLFTILQHYLIHT